MEARSVGSEVERADSVAAEVEELLREAPDPESARELARGVSFGLLLGALDLLDDELIADIIDFSREVFS